ncbi:MAG: flagellar motor protein MotB [Rhodospirillaceae bacterium]
MITPRRTQQQASLEQQHRASQLWLLTFTDLASLMLAFFVMLFSMLNVKLDRWQNVIDSLSQTLSPEEVKTPSESTSTHNVATVLRKRAINLDYLISVLRDKIEGDDLLDKTQFMRLEDRLIMALPGDLLFQGGRAVMTDRARKALYRLGSALKTIDNQIGVNGHSDPSPIEGGDYASNWELSTARAAAVANAIRRAGYDAPIVAFGYSDSRYNQLPQMPPEQRQLMGRRVDVVIFPTSGGLR